MREFIVEADGGSRGNPGPAGYGAVVSDAATGETLRETAEYIGVATNNVAEYQGLLAGLRAARELDPEAAVHVRMDSKLVVEQMTGRWKIKHPGMKPLAAQAARVFPPERVTYEWIPRERNKHADRLANEAMDAGERGERWQASASPDTPDARPAAPGPSGPPGDAAAGAARVRAASAPASAGPPAPAGSVRTGAAEPAAGTARTDERAGRAAVPGAQASPPAPGAEADRTDADVRAARTVATPSSGWAPADMGPPATFVLLRHGETPLTPQKRFSGSGGSDPSLSGVGREQAEKVAAALARRGTVQAIVASPLARTRETAGIVAARLGLEVTVDEGLRETDFGAWEGLTFAEVRERHPDDLNAWLSSPDAEPTGGGESFAATATRVAAARDKLSAAYAGRTVLLVTHVTPIKTLIRLALGAPPEALFRMELSAASLSAVAYYADGNASVRLFNDTSHLR
ncbi:bifunctional RNase H/acid phosphatase [Streptomyces griseomycini]|uniref:Phosphoglycerate mutase n=1 Tax=Streptomyces griseomycini TaxID=66895 RepID=A0A7W7LUM8_9ACTN|nr:bifunctional RNase H/acid phosphatase [Streptomyces griseomycini]MBB4896519.1 putative phosphoglycerate mutase [Streptomyces griseomycini]GGP84864.1 bifunctional RNase H/acid phosphatase [Streptomyces griseomycini]GGR01802.1 bifunctional RNase H/acid phosphatase [Streptomyces griseomycini]